MMDKQDKIYLFITGMLLLLMATFASCAKADQQGYELGEVSEQHT